MQLYTLNGTVNYAKSEKDFEIQGDMNLGALEDKITDIIEHETKATSFVFVVGVK